MIHVTKRIIAILLVVTAIYTPAASARPIDRVLPPGTVHGYQARHYDVADAQISNSTKPPVQATVESASDGFDWADAGIGGAAVFALLSLGTGALLVARRGRERRPATTT